MPKVSVIIPTFNREKYLNNTIDSVLAQTYHNYEIIVVDDGSTDNTREVAKKYKDKIKYVYQKNQGVSSARNSGIKVSRGEWIAFLDSDDEWLPEYLLYQVNQTKNNQGASVYISNALIMENGKQINYFQKWNLLPLFRNSNYVTLKKPLYFVIKYHIASVVTAIINKEVLLKVGVFDERLSIAEDYDVLARMALHGPFAFSKEKLVCIYRRDEPIDNLEKQLDLNGIRSRKAFEIIYNNIRKHPEISIKEKSILDKTLSANQRALANLILRNGRLSEARHYYKEAMLIYPSVKSITKYLISLFPAKIVELFAWKGGNIIPGEDMSVEINDSK